LRGRNFVEEECKWNGRKAVLLTHRFWMLRFHGDPGIVGRAITLNKQPTEVVGILPPSFDFSSVFSPGSKVDLVVPFPICAETDRWGNTLAVIGRLKPGVSLQAARQEFDLLNSQMKKDHPEYGGDFTARLSPLQEQISGRFRRPFLVLFAAMLCVLLIACANVSNLLLARAAARRKEVAVRMALGAGRARIVRQMLTESLLLSGFGAGLGMPFAYLAASGMSHSRTFDLPLLPTVAIDARVLAFALLIALAAGLFCGIVPTFQLFNTDIQTDLKDAGRGGGYGYRRVRAREALVLAEVAASFGLLVGAGLLLHSFLRLLEVNPGFKPEQVAAWPLQPSRNFTNLTEEAVFYQDIIQRIEALPGVVSAGMSDTLPLSRNRFWIAVAKGLGYRRGDGAFPRIVDSGYLRAMRIPLLSGREFNSHDTAETEKVMIINEAMARKFWNGKDPLGQIVRTVGVTGRSEYRVVGVAGNVRHSALEEASGHAERRIQAVERYCGQGCRPEAAHHRSHQPLFTAGAGPCLGGHLRGGCLLRQPADLGTRRAGRPWRLFPEHRQTCHSAGNETCRDRAGRGSDWLLVDDSSARAAPLRRQRPGSFDLPCQRPAPGGRRAAGLLWPGSARRPRGSPGSLESRVAPGDARGSDVQCSLVRGRLVRTAAEFRLPKRASPAQHRLEQGHPNGRHHNISGVRPERQNGTQFRGSAACEGDFREPDFTGPGHRRKGLRPVGRSCLGRRCGPGEFSVPRRRRAAAPQAADGGGQPKRPA